MTLKNIDDSSSINEVQNFFFLNINKYSALMKAKTRQNSNIKSITRNTDKSIFLIICLPHLYNLSIAHTVIQKMCD